MCAALLPVDFPGAFGGRYRPIMEPMRRALLSVSDKTGLVPLAQVLAAAGVELISTGGTAKALREAGLSVTDLSAHTGFPEMLDGRVKTLHPKVHGGLLYIRGNDQHEAAVRAHGIQPIDLVVVNLYPFEQTVARPNVPLHDAIENIDIGGPSMLRSAAKNHDSVTVVVDPADYDEDKASVSEPREMARELSLGKARAAARKHRKAIIIAADTLVVLGGRVFGKPHTNAQAREMLRALNGKTHSVITGFTTLNTESGKVVSRFVETKVHMRKLSLREIDAYVRTKEPLDKAGGYAIQGRGAVLVDRIEGDYSNVVGLPLSALAESLRKFGVEVL